MDYWHLDPIGWTVSEIARNVLLLFRTIGDTWQVIIVHDLTVTPR